METVVKTLLEVVEHLAYSHTFRSEAVANRVRELLGEARAALEGPAPAPAEQPVPAPADQAPAAAPVPDVPTGAEYYGNA